MKKIFNEFKEFAFKGNVIDLAVGVIIGTAFGKITTSFVNDVIMPAISTITGKIDFSNLFLSMDGNKYLTIAQAKENTSVIAYGSFIMTVIDFLITAVVIFTFVKWMNKLSKLKKAEEVVIEEITTKKCPYCISEINIEAVKCPHCASEILIADKEF